MESPRRNPGFCLIFLTILSLSTVSHSFAPVDHYLIDCGSAEAVIVDLDNRHFAGDSVRSNSPVLSSTRTISLRNPNPPLGLSPIYHTARVFENPSKYEFRIRDKGTHLVRLHFHQLDYSTHCIKDALFHVTVNEFLLLGNFSGSNTIKPIIKDYMIWVDTKKLVITFTPTKKSKFAYVNAIEVISAPKDLIADTALFVNSETIEKIDGLTKQALETVYRVNVGGPKVTPFNDSLWRTWVPDNEFLKSSDGWKRVYFSGRIKYQLGGASREIGPDNVYNSARVISSTNGSIPNLNITWSFPVIGGYKYLVRMHFCDIASISVELLYFNVYLNGNLAYKNLDLSSITNEMLASPFYADFLVDGDIFGLLNVSVGPSDMSIPHSVDAILNGVEIMKMNNSKGSLDGELSAESVLTSWPRRKIHVLVPFIAAMCLLLTASMVMRRKIIGVKDYPAWSPLSVDVPEVSLKGVNKQLSGRP